MATADESGTRPSDPGGKSVGDYIEYWWHFDSRIVEKLMHIWQLAKPVIAAVNGYAMGGGSGTRSPAISRSLQSAPFLPNPKCGTFQIRLFCLRPLRLEGGKPLRLTGDHIDAQEALRIGLVNEVVRTRTDSPCAPSRGAHRDGPGSVGAHEQGHHHAGIAGLGVLSGMNLNGALSAMAHASHGPERDKLLPRKSRVACAPF